MASVALLVLPSAARAEDQRTDPEADSPAGAIYQIPLDTGRRDAAPLPHRAPPRGGSGGGQGAGSGGGAGAGGTSSDGSMAPGPAADGGSSASGTAASGAASRAPSPASSPDAAAAKPRPGGASPDDPSSIHSENGFGSSSRVPRAEAARLGASSGGGGPSTLPAVALVLVIGGLAAWVGKSVAASVRDA